MKAAILFDANDRHSAPPTFGRGVPRRLPDPTPADVRWWADQNEYSRDRGCPLHIYMARDAGRYVSIYLANTPRRFGA